MKKNFKIILIFFITVFIFDLSSFFLFDKFVKKLVPSYKNSSEGRAYPQYHFIKHKTRGFDINFNFESVVSNKPIEAGTYKVWGNEIGCFDESIDRIKKNPLKKIIYLAGDSFTWGYAPFDKKFGYLIEKNLNYHVIKCGVTHTGQLHQFKKFKEIYDKGYKPDIVIVNITGNDVNNDFFFPHSTVIDGWMIEDVKWCLRENELYWERIEHNKLYQQYMSYKHGEKFNFEKIKRLIKYYSASSVLTYVYTVKILKKNNIKNNKKECNFRKEIYEFEDFEYNSSKFSLANRKIIRKWIEDSKKNNYKIYFSIIGKSYQHYNQKKTFIGSLGGDIIDFNEWIKEKKLMYKELLWKYDGHFNIKGNEEYSKFLINKTKL